MNLGADMVRDQPHDPLAIGGIKTLSSIGEALREPIDPEPSVGIEHHLDDRLIFQKFGDGGTERRAQHARAADDRFRFLSENRHIAPVSLGPRSAGRDRNSGPVDRDD